MIENLPAYISVVFGLTTLAVLLLFYWTIKNSNSESTRNKSTMIAAGLALWLLVQAALTLADVYNTNTYSLPPKIMLFGVFPAIVALILIFSSKKGRDFADSLPLEHITYINIVRFPVEMVLLWLFLHDAVPQLMTFEGRNFDVVAGITAPFIAYHGLTKKKLSANIILIWNCICLGLLLNIIVNGILSTPTPFQQFAFDQPNIALLNFPFSWLPTFVVPIVLFGHFASIRRLIGKSKQ